MSAKLDIQTKINNMLDELPDSPAGEKRREHTLSKHDARWLANMMLVIVDSGGCNRGLSEDQASALKEMSPETLRNLKGMVRERRRILALIGTAFFGVLVFVGQKLLDLMDSGMWKALFVKH